MQQQDRIGECSKELADKFAKTNEGDLDEYLGVKVEIQKL